MAIQCDRCGELAIRVGKGEVVVAGRKILDSWGEDPLEIDLCSNCAKIFECLITRWLDPQLTQAEALPIKESQHGR